MDPYHFVAIYRMAAPVPLYSPLNHLRGEQCTTGAFTLIGAQEGAENGCPQRAAFAAEKTANRSRRSTSKSARETTVGDLLANRWQTAVRSAPSTQEAGRDTRPVLLVWGGAPRRNRTGDPILTMDVLCRLS